MSVHDESKNNEQAEVVESKAVSRRNFLKMAAVTGGVIGVGGGLGSVIAACGGSTSTTAGSGGTNVTSGAESGRAIKVGFVMPLTGSLAPFAAGGKWAKKHFEDATKGGKVLGDKKNHTFEITMMDTQSDSGRAAQVTGDLINNTEVDIVLVGGTPDTVNPATATAEGNACPLLAAWDEWHAFVDKAPKAGYGWAYTYAFDDVGTMMNFSEVMKQMTTNKVIGLILANDADGISASKYAPPVFAGAGYKVVQTDLYNPGTEDFTAQISAMKKGGAEIMVATMVTPDFTNMWTQAHTQGFKPKIAFGHKGLIFPESVKALGTAGYDLCCAGTWTPRAKFIDSLTGKNCEQIATEYEAFTGSQWSEGLIISALFEWALDVFKNTTDIESRDATVAAIKKTNISTILGKIDFTAPIKDNSHHPHPNVCVPVQAAGQWVKSSNKWGIDKKVIYTTDPSSVAVEATLQPIAY